MILVDTSVWVDHLRAGEPRLAEQLEAAQVFGHPHVTGELALRHLVRRATVIESLRSLPQCVPATDAEVLVFVDENRLFGLGIGYVDAHLLAAVRLTRGARLWTRDRRLAQIAQRLGVAAAFE